MTYQNERRKAGKHDAECNKIITYNCKDHIDPRKGLNPLLERSKIIYKGMKTLKVITLHTSKQQTLNPITLYSCLHQPPPPQIPTLSSFQLLYAPKSCLDLIS